MGTSFSGRIPSCLLGDASSILAVLDAWVGYADPKGTPATPTPPTIAPVAICTCWWRAIIACRQTHGLSIIAQYYVTMILSRIFLVYLTK